MCGDYRTNYLMTSMSAHFLTNELPVEAIDWDEEKIEEWIRENVWEPFEVLG